MPNFTLNDERVTSLPNGLRSNIYYLHLTWLTFVYINYRIMEPPNVSKPIRTSNTFHLLSHCTIDVTPKPIRLRWICNKRKRFVATTNCIIMAIPRFAHKLLMHFWVAGEIWGWGLTGLVQAHSSGTASSNHMRVC